MKPIDFKERTSIISENQPQYLPLPVYRYKNDVSGRIVFCWKLSLKDRLKLLFRDKALIWQSVMTFNQPLQPQLLSVDKPEMPSHEDHIGN